MKNNDTDLSIYLSMHALYLSIYAIYLSICLSIYPAMSSIYLGSPHCVVANVVACDIIVGKFEL